MCSCNSGFHGNGQVCKVGLGKSPKILILKLRDIYVCQTGKTSLPDRFWWFRKVGQCDDRSCTTNGRCISPTGEGCECRDGFRYKKNTNFCEDIDECLLGHNCDPNSECVNVEGGFTCSCNSGYFGNGKTCVKGNCTDDICSLNEQCLSLTTLDCRCKDGFNRNDDTGRLKILGQSEA